MFVHGWATISWRWMTTKRSHLCYHHATIERTTTSPCLLSSILPSKEHCVDPIMSYQKAAVRLVYYLLISRIDYANCLLYDLPQCLISKLQRVRNAAARLVVRCHRCEHITPVLMKLHWLPVKQRVQYSILLLVFRAQHWLTPPYIADLLEQRATRVLRSNTNNDFYEPPSRSRYGDKISSWSTTVELSPCWDEENQLPREF